MAQGTLALFDEFAESIGDGRIDLDEAEKIRIEWEQLKSSAESFTASCEKGVYADMK